MEKETIFDRFRVGQRVFFHYNGQGYKGIFNEKIVSVDNRKHGGKFIRTEGENSMKASYFRCEYMTHVKIGAWNGDLVKQISDARALVGKKAQFLSGVAVVEGVRVITQWNEITGPFWD